MDDEKKVDIAKRVRPINITFCVLLLVAVGLKLLGFAEYVSWFELVGIWFVTLILTVFSYGVWAMSEYKD